MSQADDPSRRDFLAASAGTLASFSVPAAAAAASPGVSSGAFAFAFEEATIAHLGERMRAGSLTARALTAAYLDRIALLDRAGPQLRSVIEVNPDALAIAEALDVERKAGRVRGPLHGIPVLVKDNIASADRMSTATRPICLCPDAWRESPIHASGAPTDSRLQFPGREMTAATSASSFHPGDP